MKRFGTMALLALALSAIAAVAVAQNGGEEPGGPPEPNHAQACADVPKEDGAFGDCVSESASAFGRCVAEAAQTGEGNPTDACADLKPGRPGDGNGGNGDPETLGNGGEPAAHNPTTGLTFPPEQSGREFGQQVAENAQENAPEGGGQENNPTTGQTFPPEQGGQEFGQGVAGTAGGDHGPPG